MRRKAKRQNQESEGLRLTPNASLLTQLMYFRINRSFSLMQEIKVTTFVGLRHVL